MTGDEHARHIGHFGLDYEAPCPTSPSGWLEGAPRRAGRSFPEWPWRREPSLFVPALDIGLVSMASVCLAGDATDAAVYVPAYSFHQRLVMASPAGAR